MKSMKSRNGEHHARDRAANVKPLDESSVPQAPGRRVRRRTPKRGTRALRWVAVTLSLVLLSTSASAYLYYRHLNDSLNGRLSGSSDPVQTPTPTVTATWSAGTEVGAGKSPTPSTSSSSVGATHPYESLQTHLLFYAALSVAMLCCVALVASRFAGGVAAFGGSEGAGDRPVKVDGGNLFIIEKSKNSNHGVTFSIKHTSNRQGWLAACIHGLGRTFDLFGVVPPLERKALPSFESTILQEAYDLACARGFNDQEHEVVR